LGNTVLGVVDVFEKVPAVNKVVKNADDVVLVELELGRLLIEGIQVKGLGFEGRELPKLCVDACCGDKFECKK
jgi:hypothetical protein